MRLHRRAHAIFVKYLDISKEFTDNLVSAQGNIPLTSIIPRFSDIEIVLLHSS